MTKGRGILVYMPARFTGLLTRQDRTSTRKHEVEAGAGMGRLALFFPDNFADAEDQAARLGGGLDGVDLDQGGS